MPKAGKKPVQLMLPKNIGAIQISNDLTLIERKIMNIILLHSFNVERYNLSKNKGKVAKENNTKFNTININDIEKTLGWQSGKHRYEIRQSLDKLVSTSLKFNILKKQNTNHGKWNVTTSLLSFVITDDHNRDIIHYSFSEPIKDFVIKPRAYGWINLTYQKDINSKYTLALMEYLQGSICISKRDETKTEYITLNNYTNLIAGDKCKYSLFKNINQNLIQKPLNELNTKTNITAKAIFQKSGRKVVGISFDIKKNDHTLDNQNLELDFDCYEQILIDDNKNIPEKSNIQEERMISELMIRCNISEKKRREFLQTYTIKHIEANIKYLNKQPNWKDKTIPPTMFIRAIEDNYDNYGKEKELMKLKNDYIAELRRILNPFIDKTGREFLRNIISDYQIHKDRKNNAEIQQSIVLLKQIFTRIKYIKEELLKYSFDNEESILFEIGIKTDEDYKKSIFCSRKEVEQIQEEIYL